MVPGCYRFGSAIISTQFINHNQNTALVMPRRKSKTADNIDFDPIIEEILTQIRSICEEHQPRAAEILDRAENNKLGWGFHVTIDDSEAAIIVSTYDKFGENYSTKRTSQLDIDQGKFTEVLDSAKSKKGRKDTESLDADA